MVEIAVLIAAVDLQPALVARLSGEVRDLLIFEESAALPALRAITTRKPSLVILEHAFAETPRGKALINRLAADPALSQVSIRLVSPEIGEETTPTSPPLAAPERAPSASVPGPGHLDFSGTRRSERYAMTNPMEVLVDGKPGLLVNLSLVGAQLVTGTALKPTQRVRIALSDEVGTFRGTAVVVWASYEMPKNAGPRYRAGIDFVDPKAEVLEGYISRHAAKRV